MSFATVTPVNLCRLGQVCDLLEEQIELHEYARKNLIAKGEQSAADMAKFLANEKRGYILAIKQAIEALQ